MTAESEAAPLRRRPAIEARGLVALVRPYFSGPLNIALSVAVLLAIAAVLPGLVRWAVLDAAFLPAEPAQCAARAGACWSFVIAKSGQILFGIYPPAERWRAGLACVLVLALLGWSVRPASWRRPLVVLWLANMLLTVWLMGGGLGLEPVPSAAWGGLPVTLLLTVVAIACGFPLAILLALGRRAELRTVRLVCTGFVETVRGLPLLTILLVASLLLPLFVPDWLLPDKLVRAMIALTLFASAYLAEVVRGGLQAVPPGQTQAAQALGLGYWRTQRLVVLPQAIRLVIPALANTIIVMIKNTSLVLVVGLFDLINAGKAALADPAWPSPSLETYLFIGAVYFALSFAFARFADFLERRGSAAR